MKNQYKVTKDLMMSWAKEYDLHSKVNKRGMVLSCLLALLGVGLLVNLLINRGEWLYWYFAFLFIGLAVFRLFVARRLAWSKRYQMYSATYGVSEWLRTTEFTDEDIVLTDHTSVSHLRYECIETIKENGNVVMLYLNDNMAIRLYIDAFVEGTWAECKNIILAKMRRCKKSRQHTLSGFFTSAYTIHPLATEWGFPVCISDVCHSPLGCG